MIFSYVYQSNKLSFEELSDLLSRDDLYIVERFMSFLEKRIRSRLTESNLDKIETIHAEIIIENDMNLKAQIKDPHNYLEK